VWIVRKKTKQSINLNKKEEKQMRKWIASLAVISLLVVSSLVIYIEVLEGRPMLCDTMEEECRYCNGDWVILWCEDWGGGMTYCEFCCYNIPDPPGWKCAWPHIHEFCGMCVI